MFPALQGLGIGTWIIVVVLGICEYQYLGGMSFGVLSGVLEA